MELVLHSFGAKIRIRNGMFLVTLPDISGGGLEQEESFPVHEVTSILLQKSTSLSSDVVLYAMMNDIDIIFLDHFGQPVGRFLPSKPSKVLETWHRQLEIGHTPAGLGIARHWLVEKIRFQIKFLDRLALYWNGEKLEAIRRCQRVLRETLAKLQAFLITDDVVASAKSIRGIEGIGQKEYWATLSLLLPPEYRFDGRSRRPAQDLFNLYLNYAYAILYRYIESALFRAGVNPYIGFMHDDGHKQTSLVFDFIEPYRVWVDHLIFKLFSAKDPLQKHADELPEGGVWLDKTGRKNIATAFVERIREKTYPYRDGKNYHLDRIMFLKAQTLSSGLRGNRALPFSEN